MTRSRARFTITVAQPFRAARAADGRPEGLRYGAAAVSVTRAVSRAAAAIVTAASLLIVSRTVTTVAASHPPIPEFHTSDRCIACHNGLMTPSGEDVSIGYDRHDADSVDLYLVESFTFRVATPEAAVALVPA